MEFEQTCLYNLSSMFKYHSFFYSSGLFPKNGCEWWCTGLRTRGQVWGKIEKDFWNGLRRFVRS